VFAKIYTDEGLTGLGEGTLASRSQAIAATIVEDARYLLARIRATSRGSGRRSTAVRAGAVADSQQRAQRDRQPPSGTSWARA